MFNTDPIARLVDDLPTSSVTIYMLQGLDFVVPGQWKNITGFENTVRTVTGEANPARLEAIARRATELYQDPNQGYQRAVWLYQTVDSADQFLAGAALANKVGEKIGFLSFLTNLTPKPDTVQTIDFSLKLVSEMLAYTLVNGLPRDGIAQFAQSLSTYSHENIMRMVALISVDGLLALGPDFLGKATSILDSQLKPSDLADNAIYQQVSQVIPGNNPTEHLGFLKQTLAAAQGWMSSFQAAHNLTPARVLDSLKTVIAISDDKLDYVAAFLDAATSYYQHTGTQSVARALVARAAADIPLDFGQPKPAPTSAPPQADKTESSAKPHRPGKPSSDASANLKTYLGELNLKYEPDETSLVVDMGGVPVYVEAFGWDELPEAATEVWVYVASGFEKLSKEAASYLLEQNDIVPFGQFCLYEEEGETYIGFYYRLLGHTLNKAVLGLAIDKVAEVATSWVKEVVETAGGKAEAPKGRSRAIISTQAKSEGQILDQLKQHLTSLNLGYEMDGQSFVLTGGKTQLYVEFYQLEGIPQVAVEVSADVAEVSKVSKETGVYLLANTYNLPLGGFCLSAAEESLYLSYTILGDVLDEKSLKLALDLVGNAAKQFAKEM